MQFIAADEFRDLKRLHSLKLDGNQLPVVLEKTFVHQHELKYLCLARNRLAKITNTAFLNLTTLFELDISYNKLDRLESAAMQHVAATLQKLSISGNAFTLSVIRTVLNTVYKVWHVDLARMNLHQLPSSFLPARIRHLNISFNNFSELSAECLPVHLQELDLSHNQLKTLEERLVFKLEELHRVHLQGNLWSCDLCYITPIIYRVNRTKLFDNLTCVTPKFLKGRALITLKVEELRPCLDDYDEDDFSSEDDNKLGLVVGIGGLLLFLIVCILFVYCSCARRSRQRKRHDSNVKHETRSANEDPQALYNCKGEISFKFPLDLTDRKMSVSTIDEIKRMPNGTGI